MLSSAGDSCDDACGGANTCNLSQQIAVNSEENLQSVLETFFPSTTCIGFQDLFSASSELPGLVSFDPSFVACQYNSIAPFSPSCDDKEASTQRLCCCSATGSDCPIPSQESATSSWKLSNTGGSCDDACGGSNTCNLSQQNGVDSEENIQSVFGSFFPSKTCDFFVCFGGADAPGITSLGGCEYNNSPTTTTCGDTSTNSQRLCCCSATSSDCPLGTSPPSASPTTSAPTAPPAIDWRLGAGGDSCDTTCSGIGSCDAAANEAVVDTATITAVASYVGVTCSSPVVTGSFSTTAPFISASTDQCTALDSSATSACGDSGSSDERRFCCCGSNCPIVLPNGVSSSGVGLRQRDSGTIRLNGIPAGATILEAKLVWVVGSSGSANSPPTNQITFDGTVVTAGTAETGGSFITISDRTTSFTADVTSLVSGNGDYDLTDVVNAFVDNNTNDLAPIAVPYSQGASLIVYFNDPTRPPTQVLSDFSYTYLSFPDAPSMSRTISGFQSAGTSATLHIIGPEGEDFLDEMTVTGAMGTTPIVLDNTFDGSARNPGPDGTRGNIWDDDTHDVNSILPSGATSLTLDTNFIGDYFGWSAVILEVEVM